jgi:threonine dehydratase
MPAVPAPDAPPAPPTDAPAAALPVTYADVAAAAERLRGVAHRTPVLTARALDAATGAAVFLKAEHLQRTGAFKFRGGYHALHQLSREEKARGVVTYSSGNHAQAVALAGRLLGIPRTIVMPHDAPAVKLAATRGYGAEVVTYDPAEVTREALGAELAAERGLTLIPPYDHPHVVAGQGTAGDELFAQVDGLDLLLVCCGGGGLLSGCALAARHHAPGCRVVGVEPAAADDATRSFHTGTLHTVRRPDTIADGARTPFLGDVTFPLVRALVDDMVTVSDDDLVAAMRFVWTRMKQVVEPTGVLALAGLMSGAVEAAGQRVGVIVSGGNVDVARAARLMR